MTSTASLKPATAAVSATQGGVTRARTVIAVGALTAAAVMDGLNATIFDIAGDHMAGSVSATPDGAAWLNLAYFMAKVCALPMTALLLSWLGTRRLLSWAIILLMVGSAGCWLAPNLGLLVICRALQGVAGAAILAGGQSWLFGRFRRDRQGLIQAIFALGAIMAPTTAAPGLIMSAVTSPLRDLRQAGLARHRLGLRRLVGLGVCACRGEPLGLVRGSKDRRLKPDRGSRTLNLRALAT